MGKQRQNKHNNKILDKSNTCNITHKKLVSRHSPLHKITNIKLHNADHCLQLTGLQFKHIHALSCITAHQITRQHNHTNTQITCLTAIFQVHVA